MQHNDKGPANTLAQAGSAYLRSAAHQPVHWNQWGEPAFALAREQDKPILLDIGAVWCHWCHVMDRETYENTEIAQLINQAFVPIKVDRDERPDIDTRYQVAVSALTGQGGWPLTAFLTPEGKPFFGGTYFPPEDRYGRPGMKRILTTIAEHYRDRKADILASAEKIATALQGAEVPSGNSRNLDPAVAEGVIKEILRQFDSRHGGFGSAPKFPHASALDLLLDVYDENGSPRLLEAVTTTLEHMGRGGVYDQLGGGFHRYSVDERWVVPHFEKMSYDNAGLLRNYVQAYQATGNEFFREIAQGILTYLFTVLTCPDGGFYGSQDADYSLEDDGDYFTWTAEEAKGVLDETEFQIVAQRYHLEPQGEMHHNPAKNVLFVDQPVEAIVARMKLQAAEVAEILNRAKTKMLAARAARPAPFVDTTLYTSWNAMVISALLEAHRVLESAEARDEALKALQVLTSKSYVAGRGMYHSLVDGQARVEGMLEDQVFMAAALLDAFEVTGVRRYFDLALELTDTTIARFGDKDQGGFFDTARDATDRQGSLQIPRKPFQDAPTAAGNPVAVLVLNRLAHLADRADFREKAEKTLSLFGDRAADYGLFAATYALALRSHLRLPVEIVIVGKADESRTRELLRAAHRARLAGKRVLFFVPETVSRGDLPPGLLITLPHLPLDRLPVALVCAGQTCQPPIHDPQELTAAITAKSA